MSGRRTAARRASPHGRGSGAGLRVMTLNLCLPIPFIRNRDLPTQVRAQQTSKRADVSGPRQSSVCRPATGASCPVVALAVSSVVGYGRVHRCACAPECRYGPFPIIGTCGRSCPDPPWQHCWSSALGSLSIRRKSPSRLGLWVHPSSSLCGLCSSSSSEQASPASSVIGMLCVLLPSKFCGCACLHCCCNCQWLHEYVRTTRTCHRCTGPRASVTCTPSTCPHAPMPMQASSCILRLGGAGAITRRSE
jgi:hypothetical protein